MKQENMFINFVNIVLTPILVGLNGRHVVRPFPIVTLQNGGNRAYISQRTVVLPQKKGRHVRVNKKPRG